MSGNPGFRAAKPVGWVIRVVQTYLQLVLFWRNRLHFEQRDLESMHALPPGSGVILASNHADQTDLKVGLVMSRRCRRRFLFMVNREAFDEGFGTAGWWLQRLGAFSVERGGDNETAKRFAIDVVKRGQEVVVVFPEGEIFYLNDHVQPLKSGAVEIGMQAVSESRATRPEWTVFLIPMALKYRYRSRIGRILERRIRGLERRLRLLKFGLTARQRLAQIFATALLRRESAHNLKPETARLDDLNERVRSLREEILSQVEERYPGSSATPTTTTTTTTTTATTPAQTNDRAWRLSARLRALLNGMGQFGETLQAQILDDLEALKHVVQMGGWEPMPAGPEPSQERLAEMVLKLEREVFGTRRPRQLARRDVLIRVGSPIDLGRCLASYREDAHGVRHRVADELRGRIQALLDRETIGGDPVPMRSGEK